METLRQLRLILILIAAVLIAGTLGYKAVEFHAGNEASLLDCLYMTVITLTTVGYCEAIPMNTVGTKVFTIVLLMVGLGVILYGLSSATAILVEGKLNHLVWRRKMQNRIADLHDHFIVCGAGATGIHVVEELIRTARSFVVIEKDEAVAKQAEEIGASCVLVGDATEDHILHAAGIERAQGLVAALPEDRDNLMLTVSARQLNGRLRIISRAINPGMRQKLVRAGADGVVSPNEIGGLRMVSELVRPEVVVFLDEMLRDKKGNYRMEQVLVSEKADFAGKTLGDSKIAHRTGLVIIALKRPNEDSFIYNPRGAEQVSAGSTLVVIGSVEAVNRLREIAERN